MVTRIVKDPLNVVFPHNLAPPTVANTEEGWPQPVIFSGCPLAREGARELMLVVKNLFI